MTRLTAGASANILVPAGQQLRLRGDASITPLPVAATAQLAQQAVSGQITSVGPFQRAQRVSIAARTLVEFDLFLGVGQDARRVDWPTLGKFRAAVDQMRLGVADVRIAHIGDSIGAGAFSQGPVWAGAATSTPSVQFASLLNGILPTTFSSVFGNGGSALLNSYDPRLWGSTANWSLFTPGWLGGGSLRNDTNEASTLFFQPELPFDTITTWHLLNPGGASYGIAADGGANVGAIVSTASGGLSNGTTTRNFSQLQRIANINRQAGTGACAINGIICSDSANRRAQVFQWADSGTTSASWIDNVTQAGYSAFLGIAAVAPHLTFIHIGVNDYNTSVANGTYIANMTTLINQCRLSGDVIVCTPTPVSGGAAAQDAYYQTLRRLATDLGCPIADGYTTFGGYSYGTSLGYYEPGNDLIHPGRTGHRAIAECDYRTLFNLMN